MDDVIELDGLEGCTALVEAGVADVTGRVTSSSRQGLEITCDQECWPSGESHEVTISVFSADALFRVSGKATATGVSVVCDAGVEVQRIQRRRWPRRRMDLPATLCPVEDGTRVAGVPGRTIDVSVGGLYVETLRRLEGEGDPMVILNLPDGTTVVTGTATIAAEDHGDGWRYRLAFRDLDPEDADRLAVLTKT